MILVYDKEFQSFELFDDNEVLLVEGGQSQIYKFIEETDAICPREFRFAIEQMEEKNHNVSDFGIFGTLIFTETRL